MTEPLRKRISLVTSSAPPPQARRERPTGAYLSFRILQFAFVFIPIVVGVDKFFHLLVNWDQYLSPVALKVLGSHAHLFMRIAGIGEICVGIGVAVKPRIFCYIASAWLLSIVVNLLLTGAFFDIALRDFVLVLASLSIGPLSETFNRRTKRDHAA